MIEPGHKPLRPFFSYFGSKRTLAPRYPEPLYPLIIEPFAGSAGYSLYHHYQHEIVLVDLNPTIVDVWHKVQLADESFYDLPHGFDYVPSNLDPTTRALMGFWCARAASTPRMKVSPYARDASAGWSPTIIQRLIDQAPYIRNWHVCLGSYRQLPDVVATWFIDAPYQHLPNSYPYSRIDYEDLADFVLTRPGQVIVCEGGLANWLKFRHLA